MKRVLFLVFCTFLFPAIRAQNNPVDELFDKYSGKEGFTTVYISSKMFSMFANKDSKDEELNKTLGRLKSIRILAVEDSLKNRELNFYTELSKKTDFSSYEDLMSVKEGDEVTRFMIRQSGNTITELLVISGGHGGNALISIRGDLDLKNISSLSKTMGIQQLENLDKLEKRSPKK
jgi:hypothetical protein